MINGQSLLVHLAFFCCRLEEFVSRTEKNRSTRYSIHCTSPVATTRAMDDYILQTSFQSPKGKGKLYETAHAIHAEFPKHAPLEIRRYPLTLLLDSGRSSSTLVESKVSHLVAVGRILHTFPHARQLIQVISDENYIVVVWEHCELGDLATYCTNNLLTEEQLATLLFVAINVARHMLSQGFYLKVLTPKDFYLTAASSQHHGEVNFLFKAYGKCYPAEIPTENVNMKRDPFLEKVAESVSLHNIGHFLRRLLPLSELEMFGVNSKMEGSTEPPLLQLVRHMLHEDARQRPTFTEALHHLKMHYNATLSRFDHQLVDPGALQEGLVDQLALKFHCLPQQIHDILLKKDFGRLFGAYVVLWLPWRWTSFFHSRTRSVQAEPMPESQPKSPSTDRSISSTRNSAKIPQDCVTEYKRCLESLRLRRDMLPRSTTSLAKSPLQSSRHFLPQRSSSQLLQPLLSPVSQEDSRNTARSRRDLLNHLLVSSSYSLLCPSPSESSLMLAPKWTRPSVPHFCRVSRAKTLFLPGSSSAGSAKAIKEDSHVISALRTFTRQLAAVKETQQPYQDGFGSFIPPPPNTRGSLHTEVQWC